MEKFTIGETEFQAVKIPTANSNVLMIQGSKGFLGCGYFKVEAADKLGDAVAIVTGVSNFQEMCNAEVNQVSLKARALGIVEGMSGVHTGPGATAFTRIFASASSRATARVRPMTPCLAVVYAAIPARPTRPLAEERLTIEPEPASSMAGTSYFRQ